MKLLLACFTLLLGCDGAVAHGGDPMDAAVDAEPMRVHTPQGEVLHELPRCVDSPDAASGFCQQMRFGERVGFDTESWCAYWVPFSPCT